MSEYLVKILRGEKFTWLEGIDLRIKAADHIDAQAARIAALEAELDAARAEARSAMADAYRMGQEAENNALRDERDAARAAVNRLGRAMGVVPGAAQCFGDVIEEAIKRLSILAETEGRGVTVKLSDLRPIWKKHGGDWHGPRVETWTIPEANMTAFFNDALSALAETEATDGT